MIVYIDEGVKDCYRKIIADYFENYNKQTHYVGKIHEVFNAGV
jgi:hypothetical protein